MGSIGQLWTVTGGSTTGGILARKGQETSSLQLPERLATGALVKQVALVGQRLNFELVEGSGPNTGWVSIAMSGKALLVKAPAQSTWTPATPLVPLDRPKPEVIPAAVIATIQKFDRKTLESKLACADQNKPGEYFNMTFPHTVAQLEEFGKEWLTRAFHAAGTLAADNAVKTIVSLRGFAGGGAGYKAELIVEYEKLDDSLHTQLFVKLPLPTSEPNRASCIQLQQEPSEIIFNRFYASSLPFRAPKYYFGDWNSETTNWILISEKLPFAARSTRGQRQAPFQFEAPALKAMDWVLNDEAEKYYALWRTAAMLGAYAHAGKLGDQIQSVFEKTPDMRAIFPMPEKTLRPCFVQVKDFVLNVASGCFPKHIADPGFLEKFEEEAVEVGKHIHCFNAYLQSKGEHAYGLLHPNLQLDNGFYWVDEEGRTDAGLLDWGNIQFGTFAASMAANLNSADADVRAGHISSLCHCFVSTLLEFGGPKVDLDYFYHHASLVDMKSIIGACTSVEKGIFGGIYDWKPKHEWKTVTGLDDPVWKVEDVPTMMVRFSVVALVEGIKTWQAAGYYSKFQSWREEFGKK